MEFEQFSQYFISKKFYKFSGRFGIFPICAAFGLVTLPFLASAKGVGEFLRMPEAKNPGNSQTMDLLRGNLNPNPLSIGGPAVAIVDGTAITASIEESSAFIDKGLDGSGQISVYIVRDGDTLGEIATMFNVSTNTIRWANDLKGNTLKVGDELVILPISGVRHTVKSGDTLQTISKKYKADLEDILSYNNIPAGSKIVAGDVIIIPDGVLSSTQTSVATQSSNQTVVSGYYMRPISSGKKSQGIHGHNGVDLAAPVGTSIVASASGKVILSRTGGYNGGYGTYVVVSHDNGTQTLYAHMDKNYVSVGDYIEKGAAVGTIGMTGKTTGPHVHFEVRGARNPF